MGVMTLDQIKEKTSEQVQAAERRIAQLTSDASRVAAAVSTAVEDGVVVASRAVKRGYRAAGDLVGDTTHRIKQQPLGWVGAAFGMGLAAGWLVGRFGKRK